MLRGRSSRLSWLLSCLLMAGACNRSFVPHGPVSLAASQNTGEAVLSLQWLGVSSWIISSGGDVIVVDPFFSRPSFPSVIYSWLFPSLAGNFGYNSKRINDVLPELPNNTRFLLLGHGHYDHLMDVPYYIKRKSGEGVSYIGNQTAYNILMAFKPAHLNFTIAGKEGRDVAAGKIRIKALPSDHAPHLLGIKAMSGEAESMDSFPTNSGQYLEGQTLVYFIDFLNDQNQIIWRVFVNGAASSPDGAAALKEQTAFLNEHPTNVAILCVPGWDKVPDYPNSILEILKPEIVMLSHYDDFGAPYKNGEDPQSGMRFVPFANYDGFLQEVNRLKEAHNYRYQIYQPKTGECILLPRSARNLSCQS